MKKHRILLQPLGKSLIVNDQTPLIDVLHEYGIEFPCGGKGTCGKCKVKLLEGEIGLTAVHQQKLTALCLSDEWRLACHSRCTSDITLEVEQCNHIILADESSFDFVPQTGFGVAVDVGTTTLVAQLIDLSSGKVIAVETRINPQGKYGADLISRIQSCINGYASEMTYMIRQAIGSMIEQMLRLHKVEIKRISLVGNSAMQLIFSNADVTPLAAYPFDSANSGQKEFSVSELNWKFKVKEKIIFFPSIGSFVGSDILAGIVATNLHNKENYCALIDLGTNGEIVVGNQHRIVCASTAAGPAFEGTNISIGMRAVTGAISSVYFRDNLLKYNTIGNVKPKGICGSALIDAIACFRESDLIGVFGEINSGENQIALTTGLGLTQTDINEFQLAKAAIAAGFEILCKSLSIEVKDIQELYIAGGFGNYINIRHLIQTGMIDLPEERIHKMGNTALTGAKIFLFADNQISNEILSKTTHINLERDAEFQNIYVEKMLF